MKCRVGIAPPFRTRARTAPSWRALSAALIVFPLSVGPAPGALAQPPPRLGGSVSQTGPYARLGQNQVRGYRLCVKHTNEKGGVLGRRLELLVEDDRAEPAAAVPLYEKPITQDTVAAGPGA